MNFVRFEDSTHRVVTYDLSFVAGVLQVVGFDVLPDFLHCLRSRELTHSSDLRERL